MPGIVGFPQPYCVNDFTHGCFQSMSGEPVFSYSDSCELFVKSVKGQVGVGVKEDQDTIIVLFGEMYPSNLLKTPTLETMNSAFKTGDISSFMNKLNGYFSCLILDKANNKLLLISDRYGLKQLYIWRNDDKFAGVASEIKSLLLHSKHEVKINPQTVKTFIDVGHFLGQQTLHTNIQRLAPATIVEIDLSDNSLKENLYWSWSEIEKNTSDSESVAVEKSFKLFDQALQRQLSKLKQDNLAITLSGGLDSRVLLAGALKHFPGTIETFTFGSLGCDDALLAQQVAELGKVNNQFIEVNEANWYEGREDGVWHTDGMKNILHMHARSSLEKITHHSNYLLNGFLGDVTFGGSYLFDTNCSCKSLNEKSYAKYGTHGMNAMPESPYFASELSDSLFIYNRGVRFIGAGSDLLGEQLQNIKPFFDNDLIEYLYSVPEKWRRGGRLYHKMLLSYYPEFFKEIPWQQTGKPITVHGEIEVKQTQTIKKRIFDLVKGSPFDSILRKMYRKVVKSSDYVSYDAWLRTEKFKEYVLCTLNSQDSVVSDIISNEKLNHILKEYYKGNSTYKPDVIGSLLTIEIYCQQLIKCGKEIKIQ